MDQLDKLERHAIQHFRAVGLAVLLNKEGRPPAQIPGAGDFALTSVTNGAGKVLTYGEAAALLGVQRQAVKKRLWALRNKGITAVKIEGGRIVC